jgi:hypothetical protein
MTASIHVRPRQPCASNHPRQALRLRASRFLFTVACSAGVAACGDLTAPPQLTEDPAGEPPATQLTANPRIAFVRSFSDGTDEIFVANTDGSGAAAIPVLGPCAEYADMLHAPRISPDGTRLLIGAGGMSPEGTCVMGADGSNPVMLRNVYDNAKWSPDGRRLLYYGYDGFSTIGSDGSGYRHVLGQDELPGAGPPDPGEYRSAAGEWIDQNTIAFIWNGAIWSMEPDGSDIRLLGTVGAEIDLYSANWSPDGRRIAFSGPDPANSSLQVIGSMAADGTDVRIHLTTATTGQALEWSPDSRLIAFHSVGPNARIHVVDVQTGAVAQLVPDVEGAQGAYDDRGLTWAAIED